MMICALQSKISDFQLIKASPIILNIECKVLTSILWCSQATLWEGTAFLGIRESLA